MSDSFDFCEIVNHRAMLRQLLSIMQQGQTECTDTECYDPPESLNNDNLDTGSFTTTIMLLVLVVLLFFSRPGRNPVQEKVAPANSYQGPEGPSPGVG